MLLPTANSVGNLPSDDKVKNEDNLPFSTLSLLFYTFNSFESSKKNYSEQKRRK